MLMMIITIRAYDICPAISHLLADDVTNVKNKPLRHSPQKSLKMPLMHVMVIVEPGAGENPSSHMTFTATPMFAPVSLVGSRTTLSGRTSSEMSHPEI